MKIEPSHLELLAAVVDQGGVSGGAAMLGRSQPSVSRTISALEARIGEPLFLPHRKPLQPTELGLKLAESGRVILQATREAGELVDGFRDGRAGVVRVGGTPFFMDGVISNLLGDFQQQNADVRIEQFNGYVADLVRMLANGALDLVICPIDPRAVPSGLAFETLMPGRNVIVGRTSHPIMANRSLTLQDLRGMSWITPPTDSPLFSDLDDTLRGLGVPDYRVIFTGGSLSSILNFLQGSDALTVLPYSVVFTQRRFYDIRALRIRIDHPSRDLGVLQREEGRLSPAARRFRRQIVSVFKTLSQTIAHHEHNTLWKR